jgi:hypothetical protein
MVDSLEDNAKKHRLLLNAKPNTLKMLAFTATSTLEALQKSVSLLIRSLDNKSVSMRSATAAMRKFSLIVIDYVETTLIKLKGPVLIKVWQAGVWGFYMRCHISIINKAAHKDKPRSILDCICEPRYNLFMTFSASGANTHTSHTQTCHLVSTSLTTHLSPLYLVCASPSSIFSSLSLTTPFHIFPPGFRFVRYNNQQLLLTTESTSRPSRWERLRNWSKSLCLRNTVFPEKLKRL